jgi:hypothetical protein
VEALIKFLRTVFGAELRGEIHYRDDGSVKHTAGSGHLTTAALGSDFPIEPRAGDYPIPLDGRR